MKFISKIALLLLLISCGRDYENPVDSIVYLSPPAGLSFSQYQDGIMISWDNNKSYTTGYQIERKSNLNPYQVIALVTEQGADYFIDTTVITGINYEYRIQGVADENKSGYFGPVSFKAEFPAPSGLQSTLLSLSSIRLNWTDNSTFEQGFVIERRIDSNTAWFIVGQTSLNTTAYTDQGLEYNHSYHYRVRAITKRNQSDYTASVYCKVEIVAPTNLTATALSDHEISISWTDNSSLDNGFKIERMENDNYQWHQVGTTPRNVFTFLDDSLKANTKYTYRVRAINGEYESSTSNYAERSIVFPAPNNFSLESLSAFSARLTWDDIYDYEKGYTLKYVREGSMDTVTVDLAANTIQFLFDNISQNDRYLVRISAFTDFNISSVAEIMLEYKKVYSVNQTFTKNSSVVNEVKFSPNGSLLAAGDSENQVSVFDTNPWGFIQIVPGDTAVSDDGVSSLSFAVDFPWLAMGNKNGSVRIVNTNSMDEVSRLYLNSYSLNACAFSANDAFIAAAQYKYIYVWRTSDWSFVKNLSGHNLDIYAIDFSPDGHWLASGSMDGSVRLWSAGTWVELKSTSGTVMDPKCRCLRFSPDSKWLAYSGGTGISIVLQSTDNWLVTDFLPDVQDVVINLDFSYDGKMLAAVKKNSGNVYIFSKETLELIDVLTIEDAELVSVDFAPDSYKIVAGDTEGKIYIWDSTGGWELN
jgi:WD40 repeat protein